MTNKRDELKTQILESLDSEVRKFERSGDSGSATVLEIAADIVEDEFAAMESKQEISKTTISEQIEVYGYGCAELELSVDNRLSELIDRQYLNGRVRAFAETIANDLYRRKRTVNR